ncbi:MAG: hypothetical protein AB7S36_19560, partial [Planctomycetota bacterium]
MMRVDCNPDRTRTATLCLVLVVALLATSGRAQDASSRPGSTPAPPAPLDTTVVFTTQAIANDHIVVAVS